MQTELFAVLVGLLVASTAGCGMASEMGSDSGDTTGGATTGTSCAASTCAAGCTTGCSTPPPEHEVESSYTSPVATGTYVWIANPKSGRVAYIDATTFAIRLVDAGLAPTFLAAIPDATDDVAIVLNVGSRDATVLRAHDGVVTTARAEIPSGGNGWAVSNHGRFALAWTDARKEEHADALDGFQSVTVVDLAKGDAASELTVGYRPVAIAFDAAETRAFAITQDGITVVDLAASGGPAVVGNIALSDDPAEDVATRDVAVTPDGRYALVRRDGAHALTAVALATGARTEVALPGAATDMDLSADGATAVVVMREAGKVALVPIPAALDDPTAARFVDVHGATVGSASLPASSSVGFFYTNATPSSLLVSIDAAEDSPVAKLTLLRAPIDAVFPSLDAASALVLHKVAPAGDATYAAAFSLVPAALSLPPKIVGVRAPPVAVAVAPAGDRALVATGDDVKHVYELYVARLPSLETTLVPLASLPIAAGIAAKGSRGFVAQEHPEGRITFVDFATGEARTLTGFELAAGVVDGSDGSKP